MCERGWSAQCPTKQGGPEKTKKTSKKEEDEITTLRPDVEEMCTRTLVVDCFRTNKHAVYSINRRRRTYYYERKSCRFMLRALHFFRGAKWR
mmetsp:Transcript_1936/g.3761  ORF Transcript_1936/g.3761 Transcript_1936/m.3761 type:complete len:92 (+) Transcript_1936:402-677(+)